MFYVTEMAHHLSYFVKTAVDAIKTRTCELLLCIKNILIVFKKQNTSESFSNCIFLDCISDRIKRFFYL